MEAIMGQYWKVVNLDRKEYVNPHKLGCGLKLWEQLAGHPGTGAALIILCAAMPEQRGGGDLDLDDEEGFVSDLKEAAGQGYAEIAKRTIGRWAGDRIALIGDYAERGDLKPGDNADIIYDLCTTDEERLSIVANFRKHTQEIRDAGDPRGAAAVVEDKASRLAKAKLYKDISDDVCTVIEHELRGKFSGDGWRHFEYDDYEVKIEKRR
jgi:hypothetical protein